MPKSLYNLNKDDRSTYDFLGAQCATTFGCFMAVEMCTVKKEGIVIIIITGSALMLGLILCFNVGVAFPYNLQLLQNESAIEYINDLTRIPPRSSFESL